MPKKHEQGATFGKKTGLFVEVRNNDLGTALKILKRKMNKESIFRELRTRAAYEKPGDKKRRLKSEAISRQKKNNKNNEWK